MLDGIFATLYTSTVTETAFLLSSAVSIALGFGISLAYRKISKDPGTMTSALTVLPFLVQLAGHSSRKRQSGGRRCGCRCLQSVPLPLGSGPRGTSWQSFLP